MSYRSVPSLKKGKVGERKALEYLLRLGYVVHQKNYRHEKAEVDLIAQKENMIIFFEVKLRTNLAFGYPEAFVSLQQKKNYHAAATHYIEEKNWKGAIRFDILAITYTDQWEITHFKDAF